jgi:hypothetical protein
MPAAKPVTRSAERQLPAAHPTTPMRELTLIGNVPEDSSDAPIRGPNIPRVDIGAVITKALTAAGLMKAR